MKLSGRFTTDKYLMFLIQDVTKLPSSEILGFFSDLGRKIAELGADFMVKEKTRSMRKSVFDFFPGTSIPFDLRVNGNKWKHGEEMEIHYLIEVGFPESRSMVDQKVLDNIIVEKELLGGSDMPPFERPDPKCNKMFKELMKEVQSRKLST